MFSDFTAINFGFYDELPNFGTSSSSEDTAWSWLIKEKLLSFLKCIFLDYSGFCLSGEGVPNPKSSKSSKNCYSIGGGGLKKGCYKASSIVILLNGDGSIHLLIKSTATWEAPGIKLLIDFFGNFHRF